VAREKQSERLKSHRDIRQLYEQGKGFRGNRLHLIVLKAESRKVAFAAAKSCSGAVKRNAIKRRLREAYRLQKHNFESDAHVMFIGLPRLLAGSFHELQIEIAAMAAKVAKHGTDSS